jgi:dTDP-4-dehydrorhamnose reductase
MRWLVTGAEGMLGRDVVDTLTARDGDDVRGVGRSELDVTAPGSVAEVLRASVGEGDVVVNCAAWTDVDGAEEREEAATLVNGTGPANLADACADLGARLVQVSTDYVFAGDARVPYPEGAPHAPLSAYGRSKMEGEIAVRTHLPEAHLLVRTAWLYGAHGTCFPRTIAAAARDRGALEVVDDQVGQPTWTRDVAAVVCRLVDAQVPAGTYHATSSGEASWWELAREVVEAAGLDPDIVAPTTSAAFVRPAARPSWSVLGHDAMVDLGIEPIGDWRTRWRVAAPEVLGT